MSTETLNVLKTLVIGLGTTGTDICNKVAARVRWEYGDLQQTPWIRFLCLETDAKHTPSNLASTDFVKLTISSGEFVSLVQFSQANNEAIHLKRWADKATLEKLPCEKSRRWGGQHSHDWTPGISAWHKLS